MSRSPGPHVLRVRMSLLEGGFHSFDLKPVVANAKVTQPCFESPQAFPPNVRKTARRSASLSSAAVTGLRSDAQMSLWTIR